MSNNAELKALYSRIDDPVEAINFALNHAQFMGTMGSIDFLETWRDGAWDEIESAYPEFLEQVR